MLLEQTRIDRIVNDLTNAVRYLLATGMLQRHKQCTKCHLSKFRSQRRILRNTLIVRITFAHVAEVIYR